MRSQATIRTLAKARESFKKDSTKKDIDVKKTVKKIHNYNPRSTKDGKDKK